MDNVLLTTTKWGEEKLFESLWQDEDLSDVTLVCKDGQKLILASSASRSVFQNTLKGNQHAQSLIHWSL